MKIRGVAVMAVMVGTSVSADALQVEERKVMVCMAPTADIRLEKRAKAVSSGIFAGIGIKIQWRGLSNCPTEGILITFSNETPTSLMPGALAYALPHEGRYIVVFFDRVTKKPGYVSYQQMSRQPAAGAGSQSALSRWQPGAGCSLVIRGVSWGENI